MRNCRRDGDVAMWKNEANQVVGLRQRCPDLIGWMVGSGGPIFVHMDTVILDLGKFEVTTFEGSYPQQIALTLFRVSRIILCR